LAKDVCSEVNGATTPAALLAQQEAFVKFWAHSLLRAAARRIAIHQVSLLSRRMPPAHRCPQ